MCAFLCTKLIVKKKLLSDSMGALIGSFSCATWKGAGNKETDPLSTPQ
uniref:Uncharacterized protein n=1 Tax=Arundo donax TaxID=35708 RepID=A0A0A8ZKM6_ARUDO